MKKGEATRAHILRVAADAFASAGYSATSMQDIIEASGLTKGAIYFHFESKDRLALAVLESKQAEWLTHAREQVLAKPTAVEQLRELAPAMLRLHDADPSAWSVPRLTKELAQNPDLAGEVRRPMREWIKLVEDILRRAGAETGGVRAGGDLAALAVVIVGAMDGVKELTDILDTPRTARKAFRARVLALGEMIEQLVGR